MNPSWIQATDRCPCCGSTDFTLNAFSSIDRFFDRPESYPYAECRNCKTLALRAEDWSFEKAYPQHYTEHENSPAVKWYHELFSPYFFPAVPADALEPLVDVGCGTGQFLNHLVKRFPQARGIEPSAGAVAIAQRHGLRVDCGTWEDLKPAPGSLGVIVMNQVIEHLVKPPETVFREIHTALREGGYWVMRTPNAGSIGRQNFGVYWHPLETPRHTIIYSAAGLLALARRTGFTVHALKYCGRSNDLAQSSRYRRKYGQGRSIDALFLAGGALAPAARLHAAYGNLRGGGENMEIVLKKAAGAA